MKTTEMLGPGALNERRLTELVDQMDPAIGEASSVMGAMATELIRRSLRGGVLQIGRELTVYVSQQVEEQIVEQRPLIEKAAAETATEVARGEVGAVRQAQEQADAVARDLAGRFEETSRQSHHQFETVAKAIDDTARQVDAATTSLARTLESEVAAVESRTLDSARKEFTVQLEDYKDRARQATVKIKERLDKLDATAVQLNDHQHALKTELLGAWRTERERLFQKIGELRRTHESLAQRIEVLERPRGIRRLFAWLFGRKTKPAPAEAAVELAQEAEVN
jgi:hypothetical protein